MDESSELEALLRWAAMIGISDSPSTLAPASRTSCLGHSLVVSSFPIAGGRGLAAVRDLRKGEMVLRVPRSALLTRKSVMGTDEKLSNYINKYPHLCSTQILTLCLLVEVSKGRKSWWYPYLVQLPRNYDTLENFTHFEIQAFQVEDAKWVSEKAVSKARSEWKEAVLVMQEMGLKSQFLSFRSWLWASATISSRTLHVPWDNAGCLCPVGDLFNYAAPKEEYSSDAASLSGHNDTTEMLDVKQPDGLRLTDGGYEDETTSYCFYAKRSYRKGEQVLLRYGTYTNLELLQHYGFLLDVNPNDKVFIPLDADIYTATSWPKDSLYIQPDGSPSFALLCAMRLWATPANHRKAVRHMVYTGSLLSIENELFIMKWLVKQCQHFLRLMPTTIEEDNLLLALINRMLDQPSTLDGDEIQSHKELNGFFQANCLAGSAFKSQLPAKAKRSLERLKLSIGWRLGYKTIILHCISYCKRMSEGLSCQYDSAVSENRSNMR
ncbi:hypothetical protein J5N97_016466 [Dioscorea zingiberensis]|uniref:SET domain-containing protein n=1 Tax=Dioscorea zingiberensis TaxID=325984 RepID=A0A9D5CJL7_9LILI|nr:hypothetical protein J5N97_016466 [Dioscorea zingiberensis]